MNDDVVMEGVNEYAENMEVYLRQTRADEGYPVGSTPAGRWVVQAFNEAGCNCTMVDIADLIAWLRTHRPDLLVK